MSDKTYDVIVVGAGAGGVCAAVSAARTGARTALVEKRTEIGGTGVHSPVSLICTFHGRDHRPINMGLHQELFPHAYAQSTMDKRPSAKWLTYDEKVLKDRYRELVAAESLLDLYTGSGVSEVETEGRLIRRITLENGTTMSAAFFVDSTADGNLAAFAGCGFDKGREADGAMQSATLTFTVGNIDTSQLGYPDFVTKRYCKALWADLTRLLRDAQDRGLTSNPKPGVVMFPYPDGKRLLFNSNEIIDVDPTVPGSVEEAYQTGRKYVDEMMPIIRQHPAFRNAELEYVAPSLGIREGRRIHGDYTLTEKDCLGEARFDDMVTACAYAIDIHDPSGKSTRMVGIPNSGYYHIPYRSLVTRDMDNLLIGSRCISGTHEAHSSYRVISCVTGIGQAAGTAAAMAAHDGHRNVRDVRMAELRYVLRVHHAQYVEGSIERPPSLDAMLPDPLA